MGIVVIGTVFVDIKGFPDDVYSPTGRNAGRVETVHGGVGRNVAEDIANVELRPTLVSMVDDTAAGDEVLRKLRKHKVNTDLWWPAPTAWASGWRCSTTPGTWPGPSPSGPT